MFISLKLINPIQKNDYCHFFNFLIRISLILIKIYHIHNKTFNFKLTI